MKFFSGNIVDVVNKKIFPGRIKVIRGKIAEVVLEDKKYDNFIIPGFIDSHIHIESSMLSPCEFARVATAFGTVAVVADSHEMANILGARGVKFMMSDARKSPMKFYFSAPSCVPATALETAGASLGAKEIEKLCRLPEIRHLGEMMNFYGVIRGDKETLKKIKIAKKHKKLIDGHAPALTGKDLKKYVAAGISTDHECLTKKEALEKIYLGVKIQIREGSAAKNFDDLISLADRYFESLMFCSDDKHPDDLAKGHINELVRRALKKGIDKMKVLRIACVNPVWHYDLDAGFLRKNDPADFLVIDNFENLNVLKTVIGGQTVAEKGETLISRRPPKIINKFKAKFKTAADFAIKEIQGKIPAIGVIDKQLITEKIEVQPKISNGEIVADPLNDVLKIAVVNRYQDKKPAVALVKNFHLKRGAIASSIAHDSHNIIAVGASDEDLCAAVNLIIKNKGGVCAVSLKDGIEKILPLPIAGLMSDKDFKTVARKYEEIDDLAKKFGSRLSAPLMTLSFMALLVIPEIKLSDQGLFEGGKIIPY